MPSIPSWLWITAGWALVALGASMLIRGRFYGTKLKKPQCPRCGYSTDGLATLTCPECGRTAKDSREFTRAPRRTRWRLASLLVFAAAWVLFRMPLVTAGGWAGGLPDWALARLAPAASTGQAGFSTQGRPWGGSLPGAPQPTLRERAGEDLYAEMWRRLDKGEISDSAAATYLRRRSGMENDPLASNVSFPAAWPWDAIPPRPQLQNLQGGLPSGVTTRVLRPKGPASTMRAIVYVPVSNHEYVLHSIDLPVDARSSREDFMHPVSGEQYDSATFGAMRPTIVVTPQEVFVEMQQRSPAESNVPTVANLKITVFYKGKPIGRGQSQLPSWRLRTASIQWEDGHKTLATTDAPDLEIELTGEPEGALSQYLSGGTDQRNVWVGTARGKARVVFRSQ